jgi:hypothetical protein
MRLGPPLQLRLLTGSILSPGADSQVNGVVFAHDILPTAVLSQA